MPKPDEIIAMFFQLVIGTTALFAGLAVLNPVTLPGLPEPGWIERAHDGALVGLRYGVYAGAAVCALFLLACAIRPRPER